MAKGDEYFGVLLTVGLAALGIWAALRISRFSAASSASSLPPGTVVNPQPTQDPTLNAIESHIPIVGPIVAPVSNAAGSWIVKNQFLEKNSQVGPNKGQTEASAAIFSVNTKPISYSEWGRRTEVVGNAAVKAADKLLPWNW